MEFPSAPSSIGCYLCRHWRAGKMKQKDVSSLLLKKTPKSPVTAEKLLPKQTTMLKPNKKDTLHSKTEEATTRGQEGHNQDKIKSYTCRVGNPQIGK